MKTATVSNTNLFAVAAAYLGDATQWVRIAQLNGLADSVVSGRATLALPPVDPAATGGIVTIDPIALPAPIDIYAPDGRHSAAAVWDGFNWNDGSIWQ